MGGKGGKGEERSPSADLVDVDEDQEEAAFLWGIYVRVLRTTTRNLLTSTFVNLTIRLR
jgi:hypothetical protein